MSLPINIEGLLNGHTVESERIEFKKGWNPEDILHTICAFANDINNWGGGYIILGVSEENGLPQLPPAGIPPSQLDSIQKQLLNFTRKIQPYYATVSQPYFIDGKHILVIWVPGGNERPYKTPAVLGEKGQYKYFIRRGSCSVIANTQEEGLLLDMARRTPFDSRVNHQATIEDLSFGLIRAYLEEIKSDLAADAIHMPLADLARQMRIASGPQEALLPLNVGLLFFSEQPHIHFPGAKTDIVIYKDDEGIEYTERTFTGPIHMQLRNVLSFLQTHLIEEKVIKYPTRAEADRIFNYPLAAVEEVVANAFYHRSYEFYDPIVISCFPNRIHVFSIPGPLPPVNNATLQQEKVLATIYRNRRIGDFLKELKLTEGRATGLPTIYKSMQKNGSPKPLFETDDHFTYFLATLPIHTAFEAMPAKPDETTLSILNYCLNPKKRSDILNTIGYSNHSRNHLLYIVPLLEKGWLTYTLTQTPASPNQHYITTERGRILLNEYIDTRQKSVKALGYQYNIRPNIQLRP